MPTNKPGYKNKLRAKRKALGLCATCGKDREAIVGTKTECLKCAQKRKVRQKNEYVSGSRKQWHHDTHKQRVKDGLCFRCGKCEPVKKGSTCQTCTDIQKAYRDKLKEDAFNAYGGYICACCGETIKQFLSIDHIDNSGAKHRKEIGGTRSRAICGKTMHRWLKKNKYPPGFQILCMNCNFGKHMNGGICPHKDTKQ